MRCAKEIEEEINKAIKGELGNHRDVIIDVRVIPDKIQIDILGKETITFRSIQDDEDWNSYVQYVVKSREQIMKIAKSYGLVVGVDLVMYGWNRYMLRFS